MSKQAWSKAWTESGCAASMSLTSFQDAVMMGTIKLKWVKR